MKDSGHPRDPRMGGEFGPQLVLQETGKSGQGPSEDHSASLQSGGNYFGLRAFESGAEIVNLRRDGSNASPLQFRRGLEEHPLPFHLLFHERGDESEFLHALYLDPRSAFNRDVQVLTDRPDLDERNPKPVQAIDHLALRLAQLPRRVLLQQDGRYPDPFPVRIEVSVQGDEGGPLKARRVRSIYHDLPHEVDFARALRFE